MKKISLLFLYVLLISLVNFSCSEDSEISSETQNTNNTPNTPDNPIEASQLLNVSYGSDSDQVYDIYLPENRDENTKIIILVHGGSWTSGDKEDMDIFKTIIQEDLPEYAIVNINYRLASFGVSPFPMQLNDITSVINHLKTNQNEYIISQDYGFIGASAGAHLSMLWSYDYDTENNVNMVASIVGPTNLADPAYANNTDLPIQQLLLFFGENPTSAFLETNSPLHQAKTTSPPTVLFYGRMDPLIPNSQGVDMDAKLTELGVTHEFTFYPNEGHGWEGDNLIDTRTKLNTFIVTHH